MTLRRLIAPLAAVLAGRGDHDRGCVGGDDPLARRAREKLKIALANSFIGNKWRIEMENLFKAACKMPPYKTQVDCSVYNSGNDVCKQTQQISNLISQGVDAIVINAASPTGLNGIIGRPAPAGSSSSRSTTSSRRRAR